MSSTSERADFDLEEITDRLKQRQEAIKGGARYRQIARDRQTDGTPSMDQECLNCGSHVSKDWVRVNGKDGQVAACPRCSSGREITDGLTIPERRETL